MEDFYSTPKTRPAADQAKKKNRYPHFPYDLMLAVKEKEELRIPKQWNIQPRSGANGKLDFDLLRRVSASKTDIGQTQRLLSSNEDQIRHLLSRASFDAAVPEIQFLAGATTEAIVEALLADGELPAPPGEWVTEPFDYYAFLELSEQEQLDFLILNYERINTLRGWWMELMMGSAINLREKMTFFWHGHFTTDIESAFLAQFLYIQNDTLRRHALGNFRDFLKAIYKDPAMLLYLDGFNNVVGAPNENFARELLELFTMGVGNYTEDDIKAAARAFTGWQIDPYNLTSFFNPLLHDYRSKTFMGQTGNFEGDDIIDIILEQPQTATFICTKFYKLFVNRELDEPFINELAEIFQSNNYEIKPVLQRLFTSEQFYSNNSVAALIKSPIELVISNARMLSVQSANVYFLLFASALIDQDLMMPPNVAGWPGQRSWISSTTFVLRNTISEIYINPELVRDQDTGEAPINFDPLAFAYSFGLAGARELAEAMLKHVHRMVIDEKTFDFLLTVLVGTADPEDWSLAYPGADQLVANFLIQALRLPEFQLT